MDAQGRVQSQAKGRVETGLEGLRRDRPIEGSGLLKTFKHPWFSAQNLEAKFWGKQGQGPTSNSGLEARVYLLSGWTLRVGQLLRKMASVLTSSQFVPGPWRCPGWQTQTRTISTSEFCSIQILESL